MGGTQTKGGHGHGCEVKILREKTKLLQQKLEEVMSLRGTENEVYEQEMMVHALKESEWKQQRKWLQREVKRLKKVVEDKDQRNRNRRRETVMMEKKSEKMVLQELQTELVLKQMREERERRDEAVEKWKRLYLAIKMELDNLINRTHQAGKTASWREEDESLINELQKELRAKEETIELLQAHIASIEQEESRRERELDILRQSLRIMNHRKKPKHISKEIYNTRIKLKV